MPKQGLDKSLLAKTNRIPAGVWLLGIVSLLTDISSEIINSLLPLYLVQGLMVSTIAFGIIEGFALATASATKLFSGVLSDRILSRKWLAVLGYGLAAASRPIFPLSETVAGIAAGKFLDRVGKGIRGAPRDAMVADISPPHLRGASFGLRKSLDTVGGFVGPIAAMGLMVAMQGNMRMVFWNATIPAILAVAVLAFGVHEPERCTVQRTRPVNWSDAFLLNRAAWMVIGITFVFTLVRFSEAFLLLHAFDVGLSAKAVPFVLVILHLAYGLTSYPAGWLSDRVGRRPILCIGAAALAVTHLTLGNASSLVTLWLGVVLWGIHMGITQGVLASMLSDVAPPQLRGSAFGVVSVVTGAAMFAGNAFTGILWHWYGAGVVWGAGLKSCEHVNAFIPPTGN